MDINKIVNENSLTVEINGRIDTQTAPALQQELEESIEGIDELILDFNNVSYISSAGLRTIVTAQNWMDNKNGTMIIRGAKKNIINVFKVTGFDTFLTLE